MQLGTSCAKIIVVPSFSLCIAGAWPLSKVLAYLFLISTCPAIDRKNNLFDIFIRLPPSVSVSCSALTFNSATSTTWAISEIGPCLYPIPYEAAWWSRMCPHICKLPLRDRCVIIFTLYFNHDFFFFFCLSLLS